MGYGKKSSNGYRKSSVGNFASKIQTIAIKVGENAQEPFDKSVSRQLLSISAKMENQWIATGKVKAGTGDEEGEIFVQWQKGGEKLWWRQGVNPNSAKPKALTDSFKK